MRNFTNAISVLRYAVDRDGYIILARRGQVIILRGGCVNRLRNARLLRNKVENSKVKPGFHKKEGGPDGLVRSP